MKDKARIFLIITCILIVLAGILIFAKSRTATKVEKMKLEDVSNQLMYYMYNVDNKDYKEVEKYILYALDHALYEENKNSLTVQEIKKYIDSIFVNKITEEDYSKAGISEEMIKRNIIYSVENDSYSINTIEMTNAEIASTPIYAYSINKISKSGFNKYKVVYTKYKISNPYTILNYYNDKNDENRNKKYLKTDNGENINVEYEPVIVDTTDINKYLTGEEKRGILNKYLTNDYLEKNAEKTGKTTVTYKVVNGSIMIDKIKVD